MTTITIKNGFRKKNIVVKTPQEALQTLLDSMGYVYLFPITDEHINQKLRKHAKNNKDRSITDYDNL